MLLWSIALAQAQSNKRQSNLLDLFITQVLFFNQLDNIKHHSLYRQMRIQQSGPQRHSNNHMIHTPTKCCISKLRLEGMGMDLIIVHKENYLNIREKRICFLSFSSRGLLILTKYKGSSLVERRSRHEGPGFDTPQGKSFLL